MSVRVILLGLGLLGVCSHAIPQHIRVVEVRDLPRNYPRAVDQQRREEQVIFEFFKPRGLGIMIPGPYPPSNQYRLKFHLNLNREFDGWKQGDWNEGIILRRGVRWSYTFPSIRVAQGDVIHYWIEVEGADWEKGYKGKYEVVQPLPHGPEPGEPGPSQDCRRSSLTSFTGGQRACQGEAMVRSYTRVAPRYLRPGSQYFMLSVKQIAGLLPEESFTVFAKENIIWNATHNAFVPTLLTDKYGPDAVDATNFTIKGCTADQEDLCTASAMAYIILPPVMSGRHSSQDSFYFRYGVLEVTARLPKGDWIVPELWLLPKEEKYGNSSGKIILAKSRGNLDLQDGEKDYSSRVLEAGVQTGAGARMFRKTSSKPWSDDYHRFKLVWTPEKMEFYVDNEEIGRIEAGNESLDTHIQGSKLAPFDQEFYLVFGVHVGGDSDFPNSLAGKPWKNYEPKNKLKFWQAREDWQSTWGPASALIIRGLSVTAL